MGPTITQIQAGGAAEVEAPGSAQTQGSPDLPRPPEYPKYSTIELARLSLG